MQLVLVLRRAGRESECRKCDTVGVRGILRLAGVGVGIAGCGDQVGPGEPVIDICRVVFDLLAEGLARQVVILALAGERLKGGRVQRHRGVAVGIHLLEQRIQLHRQLLERLPVQPQSAALLHHAVLIPLAGRGVVDESWRMLTGVARRDTQLSLDERTAEPDIDTAARAAAGVGHTEYVAAHLRLERLE